MFDKNILSPIINNISKYGDRHVFCINEKDYTYDEFGRCISKIRKAIRDSVNERKNVGLIDNDDLETYAAIMAIWLEGLAYVPLSSDAPFDRNEDIIKQAGISTIVDSSNNTTFSKYNLVNSSSLIEGAIDLGIKEIEDTELLYILFTSGSTGSPKGVPISRANLSNFVTSYDTLDINVKKEDKCLQMFNLTFDLSVISYLIPLIKGASIYTVPKNEIKYAYVFKLLDECDITITMMVPSVVQYLRPYFEEMNFTSVRHSLFCGEALNLKLMEEWEDCVPNAIIYNTYGPTENTIICTSYTYNSSNNLNYNGVLSIGKDLGSTTSLIVDDDNNILSAGQKGELCLIGDQLTPGYLNNELKNKEVFFTKIIDGKLQRLYRTGDLCFVDDNGFLFYSGRLDFQTKIQGFRVELSEVEFHSKTFLGKTNAVALAIQNKIGNNEIALIIESQKSDTAALFEYLKSKMPSYMIPTQLKFIGEFPLNSNGKIDRKVLKNEFKI